MYLLSFHQKIFDTNHILEFGESSVEKKSQTASDALVQVASASTKAEFLAHSAPRFPHSLLHYHQTQRGVSDALLLTIFSTLHRLLVVG